MEQETFNVEDHFIVAIVKADTIIGHVPHFVFKYFPIPLVQFCFSGITLPLMAHVLACAAITYVSMRLTSNMYVLNNHVCLTTRFYHLINMCM